jgi:hypothetical protein
MDCRGPLFSEEYSVSQLQILLWRTATDAIVKQRRITEATAKFIRVAWAFGYAAAAAFFFQTQ